VYPTRNTTLETPVEHIELQNSSFKIQKWWQVLETLQTNERKKVIPNLIQNAVQIITVNVILT